MSEIVSYVLLGAIIAFILVAIAWIIYQVTK